jgi:hypothetical protein
LFSSDSQKDDSVTKALLVIDLQNDYFPGGKFPLWNTDVVLQNIERAIARANADGVSVIHIQHVAKGMAPFFNEGTPGADVHPRILAAAPKAPVIVKEFADSFEKTTLEETLAKLGRYRLSGLRDDDAELRHAHGDLEGSREIQRQRPGGLLHHGQRNPPSDRSARRFDTSEAGSFERGALMKVHAIQTGSSVTET